MKAGLDRIRSLIAAGGGALRFDRYMAAALYDPEIGYYTTREVFGESGDFTTASEMTPLYARALARAFGPQVTATGARVVELGGGTGRFAADLIAALARDDLKPEVVIDEVSPRLAARQAACLETAVPTDAARFSFARIRDLAPGPTVVVANEVLDALPVRRLIVRPGGLHEQVVVDGRDGLALVERPLPEASARAVEARYGEHLAALPDGYVFELGTRVEALVRRLARLVTIGAVWFVDYGETRREYLYPGRVDGTLVCHHRHTVNHDPLARPGEQDMTAAVDFTRVAEAAVAAGFEVAGFATQAHVLVNLGFDELIADLADDDARMDAVAAMKTLLLPGQMGERMKVMLLTRGLPTRSRAFAAFDMTHRL